MRKIFSAALALVCVWFATPSWGANCNLTQRIINKTYTGVGSSVVDEHALISGITYKENTPYTITIDVEPSDITFSAGGNLLWWAIEYTDGSFDYTGVTTGNYNDGRVSVTTSSNKTVKSIAGLTVHQRWTGGTLKVSNLQIEEGTTTTPYQPYHPLCAACKNGVSPNLFETVDMTSGLYGVTLTSAANGLVTVVGTATGGGGRNTARLQNFTLPAGTYTVSFSGTKRSQLYLVAGNDSNATNLITDVNGGTFTISESKTLHFGLNLNNGTTYNDSFYIQLEAGSTATPYQPYGCIEPITIATTKYNETKFSPLNTALANAISVVDTVVSNTITQAGRIATLQTQKQTRPNDIADDNEKCPAGKKCLLVTDENNVPHWYEIVERYSLLPDGYTELQWIESTGTQYIDTGVQATGDLDIKTRFKIISYGSLFGVRDVATGASNKSVWVAALNERTIWLYNNKTTHNRLEKLNLDQWYDADINKGVLSFNGNEVASYETENFTGSDIFLFNTNEANGTLASGASVQISYFKIHNASGTLVRDFIPAKDSSGKIGMYDTVSGAFFENAGTGEFIAGDPVVE